METGTVAIEVELQRKADKRLRAILGLYARWLTERQITGLIYVCRDDAVAERIRETGPAAGLPDGALRLELLDTVQARSEGRAGMIWLAASLVAFWLCAAIGAGGAWLLRRRTTLSVRNLYLAGGATSLLCGLAILAHQVGRATRPRAAGRRPDGRRALRAAVAAGRPRRRRGAPRARAEPEMVLAARLLRGGRASASTSARRERSFTRAPGPNTSHTCR